MLSEPRGDPAIRFHIYRIFVERGHPPTAAETATALGVTEAEARAAYQRLHDAYAIVLRHGDPARVRVAHPLSAYPTPFWVSTPWGSWWGNCIWDSLGIPAMLDCDAVVETRSGAVGRPITLDVRDGRLSDESLVAHVPLPARDWWKDIDFTCGNLLAFSEREDVEEWLARTGLTRGEVVPIPTMWRLAKVWYGDRLSPEWRRRTPAEARTIFEVLGLSGEFWALG